MELVRVKIGFGQFGFPQGKDGPLDSGVTFQEKVLLVRVFKGMKKGAVLKYLGQHHRLVLVIKVTEGRVGRFRLRRGFCDRFFLRGNRPAGEIKGKLAGLFLPRLFPALAFQPVKGGLGGVLGAFFTVCRPLFLPVLAGFRLSRPLHGFLCGSRHRAAKERVCAVFVSGKAVISVGAYLIATLPHSHGL